MTVNRLQTNQLLLRMVDEDPAVEAVVVAEDADKVDVAAKAEAGAGGMQIQRQRQHQRMKVNRPTPTARVTMPSSF
jgi:hypothetical protein